MKKILIVEDEKETAYFLKDRLEKNEFKVGIALDGVSALKGIKEFEPDIIILDIVLPQLDGLEVLKWVRQNKPKISVIVTTIKKDLEDFKKGYSLEADYYITKPYSLEEVLKGVNIMVSLKEE
ncbi:MAG: response regulator [Candidatus Omnitrophota bacterium]|nr:MAG: response regulator [Candidatus Omnitrophota bacterium]